MPFTQADVDALQAQIASGTLRVTYGNPPKTVQFQALSEMLELLRLMKDEVAAATNATVDRFSRAGFKSG